MTAAHETALTPEQLAKLPAYVRQEIERLVGNARYQADRLAELSGEPTGWKAEIGHEMPVHLPEGARVIIEGPDASWSERIEVTSNRDGHALRIHGGDGLVITPHVSNIVYVDIVSQP